MTRSGEGERGDCADPHEGCITLLRVVYDSQNILYVANKRAAHEDGGFFCGSIWQVHLHASAGHQELTFKMEDLDPVGRRNQRSLSGGNNCNRQGNQI